MTEPTISCPKCGTEIRLTESLAAPLIAATRQEYERKLTQQNDQIVQREKELQEKEKAVSAARRELDRNADEQVAEQLKTERIRLAAEESKKAKAANAAEIAQKDQALQDLQEVLKSRDVKLAEAQRSAAASSLAVLRTVSFISGFRAQLFPVHACRPAVWSSKGWRRAMTVLSASGRICAGRYSEKTHAAA